MKENIKIVRKRNEKGFTMVELLAVIVMIGIVGTIGIVGVRKVLESSHKKYNESQVKLFVSAAQTYFTDNKSKLPTKTFTSKSVSLEELINNHYIDEIVDYKKNPYDVKKSYAYVTKMGTGKYAYDGELIMQNGEGTKYKENANQDSGITFKLDGIIFNENSAKQITNGSKEIIVNMYDKDTIAGYVISIYKNKKKLENLEYKEVGNTSNVTTRIKLSPDTLKDGEYYIEAKVTDIYNNQQKSRSGIIVIDATPPKCEIKLSGTIGDNGWYKDKKVDVSVKITEKNPSKYTLTTSNSPTYNNTYTNSSGDTFISPITKQGDTTGITYYGYVKDKAGNIGNCSKQFKADTTKPSCSLNAEAGTLTNGWYKQSATITWNTKTDNISGIASYGIGKTATANYNSVDRTTQGETTSAGITYYGYVKDNAGNENQCQTNTLKIDTTIPKTTITNSNHNVWKGPSDVDNDSYKLKVVTTVGPSGIKQLQRRIDGGAWEYISSSSNTTYYSDPWKAERNSTVEYRVISNSGLEGTSGSTIVKIDRTGPKIYYNANGHSGFGYNDTQNHNKMPRKIYCEDDNVKVDKSSFTGDFEKNGEFIEGEGAGERENRRWYVANTNNKKAAMSYHYLTNGTKHTMFTCKDELGNETKSYVDEGNIYCRCRASSAKGTYDAGDVVYAYNDKCTKNGKQVQCNCGNEHTKNGVTFNSGKTDGSGTDMYLSCATS